MAIMATDMAKKSKLVAAIAAALLSQATHAGDWQFTPSILLDETYTDNVELTIADEISSLVSQVGVQLDGSYQSQRLIFNWKSKSVNAFYSHNHDLDDDFHTLNSDFNLKLGSQGLSVFGNLGIENRSRNGARNALADIVSGDTVRVENYVGGLAYDVSNSDFIINSSISYNQINSEDNIGENEGYVTSISSKNGAASSLIFWDIQGNYQDRKNNDQKSTNYTGEIKLGLISSWKLNPFLRYYDEDNTGSINTRQSVESNSYGLGVRWLITPRLLFDISYNNPIGNALDSNGKPQDNYIDANLQWQPSIRTKVDATISQRFYGDSYGLNITHQNKRLTNTISYQENVESFTRNRYNVIQLGNFWCPAGDTSNLNSCFLSNDSQINFDSFELVSLNDFELIEDDVFSLNKQLSWNSQFKLPRTTLTLTASGNRREELATHIEDESKRVNLTASRRVSPRSTITLSASYTDNLFQKDTTNERQDRYRQVSIGYKKSLNKALNINVDIAHVNRSSDQQQFNYDEGRLTFKITKDF